MVPYFVKAVALTDWERQFPAIRALGDYNSAASLAALERALALPGNGRLAAAQSIAAHKTPAGMKVLWALRTDKDASMRLEVVHALARLTRPTSSRSSPRCRATRARSSAGRRSATSLSARSLEPTYDRSMSEPLALPDLWQARFGQRGAR